MAVKLTNQKPPRGSRDTWAADVTSCVLCKVNRNITSFLRGIYCYKGGEQWLQRLKTCRK